MLPNLDEIPSSLSDEHSYSGIPHTGQSELPGPEIAVGLRDGKTAHPAMMPEATVHEDGDLCRWEGDVHGCPADKVIHPEPSNPGLREGMA
jgi:hypothetical protein